LTWRYLPLREVAPPAPSELQFAPEDSVWHLTLDQIESHTGRIVNKRVAVAGEAGNSTFTFDSGNVLYSKLRPYLNKVVLPSEPGVATTELVPLRPIPGVLLSDFLAYYLRSPEFVGFAEECVAGAKMPRVIMSQFWEKSIPLPPPSEQRRIVQILDQASALRRKRAEADALADRILPAVFNTMFGDPTTNKQRWSMGKLGDVIHEGPQNGLYKPSSDYGTGTPILRIDGFYDGTLVPERMLKRVRLSETEIAAYRLKLNDIVINRVNSPEFLGKSALITGLDEATVYESNMMRFAIDKGAVTPEYVINLLQSPATKAFFLQRSKRAVNQASINQEDVRSLPIPIPPLELQREFSKKAWHISAIVVKQRLATKNVIGLFEFLLQRAFSGTLTVRWCEAHLKELLAEMELQARLLGDSRLEPV